MSANKEITYKSNFPDFPPLQTGSVADFIFSSPHAPLDNSPAFIDAVTGMKLSRADVLEYALRFAKGTESLGLKAGDVAMIFSPNSLAWPITFFGLLSAGIVATLANSAYTPPELAHQLKDSGARTIFVHPLLLPSLLESLKLLKVSEAEAKKRVVILTLTVQDKKDEKAVKIDGTWTRLESLFGKGKLAGPIKLSGKDTDRTTLMCYSSGTTGLSKGVETTHRNVVTILQIFQPLAPKTDRTKDIEMGLLPLYHIFGIIKVLCYSFYAGIPVVVIPKFEPILFFETVQKYKVSLIKLVPPVLVVLASHPAFEKYDLSSLSYFMSGAAPLGEGLVRRVKARFAKKYGASSKLVVIQGYGLTETSPTSHVLPPQDEMRKIGSVGVQVPHLEVRLVDDDGKDVKEGSGQPGEIWMRGPSIMKGYLNNPTATANSITPDGWFMSGDIGVRDNEGYYYVVDRKKELIKYKGFQVPPADLEAVLLTKEDVADAGVIGVEDKEQATELPRAYVVPTDTSILQPSAADKRKAYEKGVEEWIKTKVAKHKFLRGGVCAVEAIPKSGAGKILRRQLRDLAKKEALDAIAQGGKGEQAKL